MLEFPNSQKEMHELTSWKFTTTTELHERTARLVNSILENDRRHPWIIVGAAVGQGPVVRELPAEHFSFQGERGVRLAIQLEAAAMRGSYTALAFASPLVNYDGPNGVRLITVAANSVPSLSQWMCRESDGRIAYSEEVPLGPGTRVAQHFRDIFGGAGDRTAYFFRGRWTERG